MIFYPSILGKFYNYKEKKIMKKKTLSMLAAVVAVTMAMVTVLSGCSFLDNIMSTIKGELIGNDYTISQYDNFGNLVLTAKGDKVAMSCELDASGEPTSYVDITIDGHEWQHVGATLVFAQNGVDMITDFQMPDQLESSGNSSGLIAVDRFVNHYRNLIIERRTPLPECKAFGRG